MLLGALGKRESDEGLTTLSARERVVVRWQALGVALKSAIVAVVVTGLLYLLQ